MYRLLPEKFQLKAMSAFLKIFKYLVLLIVFIGLIFFWFIGTFASDKKESHYQRRWCNYNNGKMEVILKDRTIVDCLTKYQAVEFDFAAKYLHGLGQVLHYARISGKSGLLVLICKTPLDYDKVKRVQDSINYYDLPIKVISIQK